MQTQTYWVGQIPSRPMYFNVYNQRGEVFDLSGADTEVRLIMLGSDNESIDTSDGTLTIPAAEDGLVRFDWPTEQSLFNKRGEYVFQLEIKGTGRRDYTSRKTIVVRDLGGK